MAGAFARQRPVLAIWLGLRAEETENPRGHARAGFQQERRSLDGILIPLFAQ